MKALNVFVTRLCQHPILSCNEHFKIFLTANYSDFTLHRKQRYPVEHKIRTLSHSNSSQSVLKSCHIEFDKTKQYLTMLSEKLVAIEKISSRINKERCEYVSELNNFHPIFTTWAGSEPELSEVLQIIGGAVERSSAAQNALVQSYSNTVGNPVKDFLAYIDVVQETIRKREAYQCAYENSMDELNKRHTEKDKVIIIFYFVIYMFLIYKYLIFKHRFFYRLVNLKVEMYILTNYMFCLDREHCKRIVDQQSSQFLYSKKVNAVFA